MCTFTPHRTPSGGTKHTLSKPLVEEEYENEASETNQLAMKRNNDFGICQSIAASTSAIDFSNITDLKQLKMQCQNNVLDSMVKMLGAASIPPPPKNVIKLTENSHMPKKILENW